MLIVTAAQMRELDQRTIAAGTPGWTLMRRAGQGAARLLMEALPRRGRRRVVIVAGTGNNGGDGLVVAHELRKKRIPADVFLVGDEARVRGDAALALQAWRRARGKIAALRSSDDLERLARALAGATWAVDALLGTGLAGEVRGLAAQIIAALNASGLPVFAIDVPSGLDADRGCPLGTAIQARMTATFALPKIGQVIHPGVELCGRLHVVDIGISGEALAAVNPSASLLDEPTVAAWLPRRGPTAHKGDAGHVLVVAGSRGKTGAAVLCARAAARGGAGLVTAAVCESQQPLVAAGLLEAMTAVLGDRGGEVDFDANAIAAIAEGKSAVVCGPGLGTGPGAHALVDWLLETWTQPLVLDADALNCVAGRLPLQAFPNLVVTPHPGEMARLSGTTTRDVQADRVAIARDFAARHSCIVVLKGARTIVADGTGRLAVNPTGNPGMASGGMGDVLGGLIAALLAQKLQPFEAACTGVYLHGLAADMAASERGMIGLLAGDVAEMLPRARGRIGGSGLGG